MKPILFNTDMVRAILANRKTVTRRVVKQCHVDKFVISRDGALLGSFDDREPYPTVDDCPYQPGDILYVRERWRIWKAHRYEADAYIEYGAGKDGVVTGTILHFPFGSTDSTNRDSYDHFVGKWGVGQKWRPSIHMPREAARIFLKVTEVGVQQVKDITDEEAASEGFASKSEFISVFLKIYPDCTEDSWCWVIRFERIEKPPL